MVHKQRCLSFVAGVTAKGAEVLQETGRMLADFCDIGKWMKRNGNAASETHGVFRVFTKIWKKKNNFPSLSINQAM